jgi:ABC-2 type transport system ATP-binding protein
VDDPGVTTSPQISARGLARRFNTRDGTLDAVKGIDFDVAGGEIVGLLGPNGAGKTTTLRMLTTLLEPSSGEATIAGRDLASEPREVRRGIGYVAQVGATPAAGTRVAEELVTQGRLQGMSKADAVARVDALAPQLDLTGLENRALLELSGGQRRRFDIALGLVHSPSVVFLDEPTAGLDPQSRANLWQHIRDLRARQGVTILLTTHYLEEADALADRILVMDGGQLVADDTPAALKARIAGDVIQVTLTEPGGLERAERISRETLNPREVLIVSETLHVTVDDGATAIAPLLGALDQAGLQPASVNVNRPSLDDVFLTLTGRSLRDGDAVPTPA